MGPITGAPGARFDLTRITWLGSPFSPVFLAMERGEVEGLCVSLDVVSSIRPDWIAGNKAVILFQGDIAANPEIKDVPFVNDLARTPEDRQAIEFLYAGMGLRRPFIAPPGMLADRMKMVQDAFGHHEGC
jgi:hypothetical protein